MSDGRQRQLIIKDIESSALAFKRAEPVSKHCPTKFHISLVYDWANIQVCCDTFPIIFRNKLFNNQYNNRYLLLTY